MFFNPGLQARSEIFHSDNNSFQNRKKREKCTVSMAVMWIVEDVKMGKLLWNHRVIPMSGGHTPRQLPPLLRPQQ